MQKNPKFINIYIYALVGITTFLVLRLHYWFFAEVEFPVQGVLAKADFFELKYETCRRLFKSFWNIISW